MCGKNLQKLTKTSILSMKSKNLVGKILLKEFSKEDTPVEIKEELMVLAHSFNVPQIDSFLKNINLNINL